MNLRKRIAILIGQPEEDRQNSILRRLIKQAYAKDCDVCVFAMYETVHSSPQRANGEANIFSLPEYDMFEKIIIFAETINTPGVLEDIEERLHESYKKQVLFIGGKSKYYNVIPFRKNNLSAVRLPSRSNNLPGLKAFSFSKGTMTDCMLMQTKIQGLISVIHSRLDDIRPFDSFDLCLNIGWSGEAFLSAVGNYTGYSDNMLHVIECSQEDGTDRADLSTEFSRKLILPALFKPREKPKTFYFTPLLFEDQCFGYAVLGFLNTVKCYDASYKLWLSFVMHGLECFRRFNMLDVKKKQDEYMTLDKVSDILDNNRFTYHFQPIVDVSTGDIYAYEALMRTSTTPPVAPLDVIKYADRLGRLCDVESATFSNVIEFVEKHEELFENKKIFINSIPGIKIPDEDEALLRERIFNLNEEVVIELTEQAEIDDDEIEELKRKCEYIGARIAVDDYGTGYSNVYNLLRYMPDVVKIDRMLLSGIHLSSQKQHFVKEIIEFSHNNGITVLAEGVETSDELKMVIILGVDLIQGFYTARPSGEVIKQIDDKIKSEIIQYGQLAIKTHKRQIYESDANDNISLMKLVSDNYSKIIIKAENGFDNSVRIIGLPEFIANVDIEICDSYSGTVTLKDSYLSVRNEHPTIKIGRNCDVTLILEGENTIEQGGILVPDSSSLTVKGAGNLLIKQIAINGYGIGNDKDNKCGDLYFEQDGLIKIQGNILKAVGIGGGETGRIQIKSGMYAIQFIGKEAVGIGSIYSDTVLSITNCGLNFDLRCAENVGIGSLTGNADIDISHAGINGFFSSNKCVCVGVLDKGNVNFRLIQATGEFNAHSDILCGFGSISGDTTLSMTEFSFKLTVDGDEAIALGNLSKTASVLVCGDVIFNVTNKLGYDIGAAKLEITEGRSEFRLNGEIVR